ncbi:hypothetical protein GCM10009808_04000 [Microbacterium sediminicola]|uniref:2TM domain-containing protein n=1 Tax=Microbacterium sediminicola TaxID=415210 RepID=A0ABP4TLG3_9MICO
MTDAQGSGESDELRQRAVSSLKAKQGFWYTLVAWVVLSGFFTLIWAVTGMGYYWPVWPIAGIAIGVVFSGFAAYGPMRSTLSESRIQDEMRKLK